MIFERSGAEDHRRLGCQHGADITQARISSAQTAAVVILSRARATGEVGADQGLKERRANGPARVFWGWRCGHAHAHALRTPGTAPDPPLQVPSPSTLARRHWTHPLKAQPTPSRIVRSRRSSLHRRRWWRNEVSSRCCTGSGTIRASQRCATAQMRPAARSFSTELQRELLRRAVDCEQFRIRIGSRALMTPISAAHDAVRASRTPPDWAREYEFWPRESVRDPNVRSTATALSPPQPADE